MVYSLTLVTCSLTQKMVISMYIIHFFLFLTQVLGFFTTLSYQNYVTRQASPPGRVNLHNSLFVSYSFSMLVLVEKLVLIWNRLCALFCCKLHKTFRTSLPSERASWCLARMIIRLWLQRRSAFEFCNPLTYIDSGKLGISFS